MNYEQKSITIKQISSIRKDRSEQSIMAQGSDVGLAYHLKGGIGPLWTITHVASGYTLCNEATEFKNEAQCKAFIDRVAPLCDWTAEMPAPSEDVKQAVRRIATECQAMYLYTPVF